MDSRISICLEHNRYHQISYLLKHIMKHTLPKDTLDQLELNYIVSI